MLGYDIYITGLNLEGKKVNVASWKTGLGGCRWLDALAKEGLAKHLGGNGYPSSYALSLSVLLTQIAPSPPKGDGIPVLGDDYVSDGENSSFKLNLDEIKNMGPNSIVQVEAWDQS